MVPGGLINKEIDRKQYPVPRSIGDGVTKVCKRDCYEKITNAGAGKLTPRFTSGILDIRSAPLCFRHAADRPPIFKLLRNGSNSTIPHTSGCPHASWARYRVRHVARLLRSELTERPVDWLYYISVIADNDCRPMSSHATAAAAAAISPRQITEFSKATPTKTSDTVRTSNHGLLPALLMYKVRLRKKTVKQQKCHLGVPTVSFCWHFCYQIHSSYRWQMHNVLM